MHSIERSLRTKNLLWFNFLFWLIFCVFEIINSFAFSQTFNFQFEIKSLIKWPVASFLMYWILSLLAFQVYLRTRNLNGYYFIAAHSLASLLFGVLHKVFTPVIIVLLEGLLFYSTSSTFSLRFLQSRETWYDVVIPVGVYWIIFLALYVINYYRKFQDQVGKRLELESELSAAHLKTMKMQLHPHFLFNAFNTIAMMVRKGKQDESITMISNLSEMLRQSLSKETSQFVKLEEEINLLKNYLAIEAQRYKDRISICWELDAKLNSTEVPSFILQPIVENAFKHGISRNIGNSVLKISSRSIVNGIELEIYNTGSKLPKNWEFQKDKGIGLANTSTRLMKLYEKDIRFLITEKEGGVSVILEIPFREK